MKWLSKRNLELQSLTKIDRRVNDCLKKICVKYFAKIFERNHSIVFLNGRMIFLHKHKANSKFYTEAASGSAL